jgi:hypothetical protein
MKLSNLVKTRKDASMWIMSALWLIGNFVPMSIWGNEALIFTNPICLLLITIFVFYTKSHPKFESWLEEEI